MKKYKYLDANIKIKTKDKRIYQIWTDFKRRCNNKKSKDYKNYGARGIKICQEWQDDFMNFYNWAMANGYTEELTIDRIDVNGNYEPSNCRWVTMMQQQRNRRNNKLIAYNNETHCISEWAEIIGVSTACLFYRLSKWDLKKAITKKNRKD